MTYRGSAELLMRDACHEAGHYTAARLIRKIYPGRFRKIYPGIMTIVPTEGAAGSAWIRAVLPPGSAALWLDPSLSLAQKEPRLVHLLAGIASESLWLHFYGELGIEEGVEDLGPELEEILGYVRRLAVPAGGASDIECVYALVGDADWEPYLLTALSLVHRNWPAVLRVARALVDKRTMSAQDAHAAFAGRESHRLPSRL